MSELKRVHIVILTAGSIAGSVIGAYENMADARFNCDSWRDHTVDGKTDKPVIVTSWVFPEGNRSHNGAEGARAARERNVELAGRLERSARRR